MGKDYVTVKVTRDVYKDIIRAKAFMELRTGERHTMNEAIRGLLSYAPEYGAEGFQVIREDDENQKG